MLGASILAAGLVLFPFSGKEVEVPEGAAVILKPERSEYFLGETVLIDFVLENKGKVPFKIDFGGDHRGTDRPMRFKVTATDEKREKVPDPAPDQLCFGGLGGQPDVQPQGEWVQKLALLRYCEVTQPGRYLVEATHDFGWSVKGRNPPVGKIELTFRMPDEKEAERILNSAEGAVDFETLRQPVYLKPLEKRAKEGDIKAFRGIGSIATKEATKALVELASEANGELRVEAARILNLRLPVPPVQMWPVMSSRKRLAAEAWDPAFAKALSGIASKLLESKVPEEVKQGALMLDAIGTSSDAPGVMAAISRFLDPTLSPRRGAEANILDFGEPLRDLLRTMKILHGRGFKLGENPYGDQVLLYFDWLAGVPGPRPPEWFSRLEGFGTGSSYAVRQTALRSIPKPMPPECAAFVRRALADPDLGVCKEACRVAGESGDAGFIPDLLKICRTENRWVWRDATNALSALGARYELLLVSVDRLMDDPLFHDVLDHLQSVIEDEYASSSGTGVDQQKRLELQQRWQKFLSKHADSLKQGKKFKIGSPELDPALFAPARQFHLKDGTYWPPNDSAEARKGD